VLLNEGNGEEQYNYCPHAIHIRKRGRGWGFDDRFKWSKSGNGLLYETVPELNSSLALEYATWRQSIRVSALNIDW
jgi:hypothetical protein